jgi:polyisoprenoid-binding protein YceI
MKKLLIAASIGLAAMTSAHTQAATYEIDTKGAHAFVQFRIQHLGYSWLLGRFNTFEGQFEYDAAAPEKSSIEVTIDTASIDSNHADRDKHLRGEDFLNVKEHPEASFKSTGFESTGEGKGVISGAFTLNGVTRAISFPVERIGEGEDPWGGYRAGFMGKTTLKLSDYDITYNLGPASTHVEIELHIEGVRQ